MFTECCGEGVKRPPSGHYSFRQILFFFRNIKCLLRKEKKSPAVRKPSGVFAEWSTVCERFTYIYLSFLYLFFIGRFFNFFCIYRSPHTSRLQSCLWIHGDNGGVGMKYCIMEIPVNLCDVCSRHERPEIHGYHGERLAHCQVRKSMAKAFFSCVVLLDHFGQEIPE